MTMNYSELIENFLKEKAKLYESVPIETICDREKNHYLLVQIGWIDNRWIYGCLLHLDIINGKIYIQQNNTEMSIANDLVELGVPKTDIILGFQSPFKRKFTEYAAS